ncbi:polysaccharide biosynthesis protein [Roseobacter sp. AzwK-3b]|uniref:UDP-N-acetylglucosamine 4,6-dehydratase (inverting) n=1 Tax=Roseobacter sp. AzwK-3b TaxID=351016 RepID=UPI0001569085|nr:UDP-N-acetylglucosamine 4,6-dehydratase (inverting) [Roseobacter sp. AzwK-3b]EDM73238.1 polysaccharide biosynthesis protein [Roseobacter sp. AzwK-3b]
MFNNKRLLITGGTGSFGQQFICNVLENYAPSAVVVYSRDGLKQFEMQQRFPGESRLRYFIGDVRDGQRLTDAMENVDLVVHAAALKQVPAAEYNPMECVRTNITGAENVIRAAIAQKVDKVVALSTDKAAKPISLYGATKLVSDKLFVSANNTVGTNRTRFSVVRYGNVVGSRGSVIPFFHNMIGKGTNFLPITDNRMTRFWITLDQGVDFVTKAFERMWGGEIFVPRIPSTRIIDLAQAMAPDLEQRIVGIRPGEKLHEVMCPEEDAHQTLRFDNFFSITPAITFNNTDVDFARTRLGETGKRVDPEFEYNSGNNPVFLNQAEIETLLAATGFGR